LVAVFREVRRVLRDDGTLWLNLGDSYAGSGRGGNPEAGTKQGTNARSQTVGVLYGLGPVDQAAERARMKAQNDAMRAGGLKPKDLIGIPWRVAFALQADGWWLRQDIIWSKPNPMPESVTDRCTKAHEYLFLLAKSERYYFDAAAIAEDAVKAGQVLHSHGTGAKDRAGASEVNDNRTKIGLANWNQPQPDTRNKRSVWTVTTQPFKEAHFATFPPALIEPCILAGCPEGGTVLDPFGGAGTTGLVADRWQRNAVLIELNPSYADMARGRITNDAPLFAEVT
jgi:DNA modification methylase